MLSISNERRRFQLGTGWKAGKGFTDSYSRKLNNMKEFPDYCAYSQILENVALFLPIFLRRLMKLLAMDEK